jgi:transposase
MLAEIAGDESLQENFTLITSIKGVALINTVAILIATQNFSRFENARQFACYAGIAPFGKQSGTSIKGKPKVSRLANKKLKVLLTQAAKSAIRHDENLRLYYERKLSEGKEKWLILNNVKNKIVHRVFSIVKNRLPYSVNHQPLRSSQKIPAA